MKCSFYKSALDSKGFVGDISTVLGFIKSGRWMDQIIRIREIEDKDLYDEAKRLLPAVTFSGTFEPTRSLVNNTFYSQLLVFDIDKLDIKKVQLLMDAFKNDEHIMACWRSPSGNGIKGLIPVTSDLQHHYDAFECVRIYFETNYAVSIDASGKDVCRLCFVSFDSQLHYNGKAIPMPIEYREEVRKTVYGDREFSKKGLGVTADDRVKYEVAKKWAEYHKPYNDGNRNNHVFLCACTMNRVGIAFERAIVMVLGDRTDMAVKEIQDVITKVYRNKAEEFNTISVYDFEQQAEANKGAYMSLSMDELLDSITNLGEMGVTTFHEGIDKIIGGFRPGNVYGFAGPEKSYKSTLAFQIAHKNAAAGVPVIIAEGEMSMPQLMGIVTQQRNGIDIFTPGVVEKNMDALRSMAKEIELLKVVNFADGTEESLLSTIEAERSKIGKDIRLLVVDSLQNMARGRLEEVPAAMHNSGVLKEVAKKANAGRGIAIIIVMHTDSLCKPWDRQPQNFIRGKLGVKRNLDGCFGFSRFVTNDSFPDGDQKVFELRKDCYHLYVMDYRATGETINVVCNMNSDRVTTYSDTLTADMLEVKPQQQLQETKARSFR